MEKIEVVEKKGDYPQAEIIVNSTKFIEVIERDPFGDGSLIVHAILRLRATPPREKDCWQSGQDIRGIKYKSRWFAIRPINDGTTNISFCVEEFPIPPYAEKGK